MNEYKQWPTDKLISEGKRLADLLAIAPDYIAAMPDYTPHQLLAKQRAVNIVYMGEMTLKTLRNEYIQRKNQNSNDAGTGSHP